MAAPVTAYAAAFAASLHRALGSAAPAAPLAALSAAAAQLDAAAQAPASLAQWQAAVAQWTAARNALQGELHRFLLDGLPDLPGLATLASKVGWDSAEGLHGELDVGPLHLALASSSLVLQPPIGNPPVPGIVVGPYAPLGLRATIRPPFGDASLPGGGEVLRLPDAPGFAGLLHVPLGAIAADASAILEREPDGTPSFLAVLGVAFTPPLQLSFGFSLDRVGGIVGVNRAADVDALARAVRTGAAANALLAAKPPPPTTVIADLRAFFPSRRGRHVVGPTLRLSWLSLGAGSLLALDLGVVVELPTARVVILGVARAQIPGAPGLLQLRLDILGTIDPSARLAAIDASLVDSRALGVFSVYGDAAMRLAWGEPAYAVMSIGGFYPGFNPEPARLPPLRRVGLAPDVFTGPLTIRAEGYLAVTTNTIQLGARIEARFALGLVAQGFLQVDALVQFRPFYFEAACSAGFDVSAGGFHFGGVRLDGAISGPGPIVIRGRLTIETFLFDISWDEAFTIGSGSRDTLPSPPRLIAVLGEELGKTSNLRAASLHDAAVVLAPRPLRAGIAALPPAGTLQWLQRRAPLGLPIDRVDGQPLGSPQGVRVASPGTPLTASFSPGSYCTLTSAEALQRPPFDQLVAGVALAPPAPTAVPNELDDRTVETIVIVGGQRRPKGSGSRFALASAALLVATSRLPPALSDASPLVGARRETWSTVAPGATVAGHGSATEAHQFARSRGAVAMPDADAAAPLAMAGL